MHPKQSGSLPRGPFDEGPSIPEGSSSELGVVSEYKRALQPMPQYVPSHCPRYHCRLRPRSSNYCNWYGNMVFWRGNAKEGLDASP